MALASNDIGDRSLSVSASKRNFNRELPGNFYLDITTQQYRHKFFLQRNMARSLAYHEKARLLKSRKSDPAPLRLSPLPAGFVDGEGNGRRTAGNSRRSHSEQRASYAGNGMNGTVGDATPLGTEIQDQNLPHGRDTATPQGLNSSQNTPLKRRKSGQLDLSNRRSRRIRDEHPHQDVDAHLYVDFSNIRKKLNFRENRQRLEGRAQKRVKLDHIRCHAHLCIWGKIPGDPLLVRKTEACDIIKSSQTDIRDADLFVGVKLDYPFIINAKDFRVPVEKKGIMELDFVEQYFMEIKIVPTQETEAWPPIPLLGKSEGDQLNGLGELAAEQLQGSLLMRYTNLPEAPDADYAISVFYLHEGIAHRTKFAMQVDAKWAKSEELPVRTRPAIDLEPWAIDTENRPFGRSPEKTDQPKVPSKKQQHAQEVLPPPTQPVKNVSPAKVPKRVPLPVTITYKVDPAKANTAPKQFRNATVTGFRCPSCTAHKFEGLEQLHFHLSNMHHKYKFVIEQKQYQPNSDWVGCATIRIEIPESKPRFSARKDKLDEDEWSWLAPGEPFSIHKHAEGDHSWSGGPNHTKPKRQMNGISAVPIVKVDALTELRKENDGFLPADHVPDYRPAQYSRKRHRPVPLQIKYKGERTPYTSMSHRPIDLARADELSESDDEMDEEWFVAKYNENLDMSAAEAGVSEQARSLRKRWDMHLFHERFPHSRYMSDSLIRFVKQHKRWLQGADLEEENLNGRDRFSQWANGSAPIPPNSTLVDRQEAFTQLLLELFEKKVINDAVLADVQHLLHEPKIPYRATSKLFEDALRRKTPDTRINLGRDQNTTARSPWTCGMCAKPITQNGIKDVRCSNMGCATPAQFYHLKCAGLQSLEQRQTWKCKGCSKRPVS